MKVAYPWVKLYIFVDVSKKGVYFSKVTPTKQRQIISISFSLTVGIDFVKENDSSFIMRSLIGITTL